MGPHIDMLRVNKSYGTSYRHKTYSVLVNKWDLLYTCFWSKIGMELNVGLGNESYRAMRVNKWFGTNCMFLRGIYNFPGQRNNFLLKKFNLFRLNPHLKIDIHHYAVSNSTRTVHYDEAGNETL